MSLNLKRIDRCLQVHIHTCTASETGDGRMCRHPMYLGESLMFIFSPLALGSYWAMIPALVIVVLLVARIKNEERVMMRDLKGYPEYMQKTVYRLIPGVW